MQTTAVRDLLRGLLTNVVGSLTDPPARQYVAHGDRFAHDCELVATRVVQIGFDSSDTGPLPGHARQVMVPVVGLQAIWLRCWPSSDDADGITTVAEQLAVDVGAVGTGLTHAWADGTLFTGMVNRSNLVTIGPAQPISPEGGLAGWRQTVNVRL